MPLAQYVAILAAGSFFLVGLCSGVWKYVQIARSPKAEAHIYVDVAHRAALLYAFACLVVERFVELSALSDSIELAAVLAQVVFFALALGSYVLHGMLRDTGNQFEKPHRLGTRTIPSPLVVGFMVALVVAEIGGFAILFVGALIA